MKKCHNSPRLNGNQGRKWNPQTFSLGSCTRNWSRITSAQQIYQENKVLHLKKKKKKLIKNV